MNANKITVIILLIVLCLTLGACGAQKETIELNYGETYTVAVKKETPGLQWSSADEKIAGVTDGVITGKGPGSTTVTATADGKTIVEVNVTVKIIEITGIFMNQTETEMEIGDAFYLTYALVPENASDYGITWKAVNTNIATVDENGVINAVAPGKTTVICSTPGGIMATCEVTVNKPSAVSQLNEDEARFYNYLVNGGLNSFYNASAVRFRNLYAIAGEANPHAFYAELQGTNRLGGTLFKDYSVILTDEGTGFMIECVKSIDKSNPIPAEIMDSAKINAALEEYWNGASIR